jgi:hypothetical protein
VHLVRHRHFGEGEGSDERIDERQGWIDNPIG